MISVHPAFVGYVDESVVSINFHQPRNINLNSKYGMASVLFLAASIGIAASMIYLNEVCVGLPSVQNVQITPPKLRESVSLGISVVLIGTSAVIGPVWCVGADNPVYWSMSALHLFPVVVLAGVMAAVWSVRDVAKSVEALKKAKYKVA
jgi:hypothetical protein